jgi:hypothetical protein
MELTTVEEYELSAPATEDGVPQSKNAIQFIIRL